MNPATFLRVLGPEPWRVAYVEPSVRPDDARYGENPNRMGIYYQYQVVLKPDPGNPQELFLRSLGALGIDLGRHDVRFVEDRWEAPPLGAWGLGWEVWLDGLEITQFTYFQQAGGMTLDPVSVEITYGLERILMALQGVSHFKEIRWDGRRSYGDLLLTAEQEHSRYFFETADVRRLRQIFTDFEAEARRSLEAGLVFPAYDYLLKCSHTFNVLDARGSIGVAERASYFGKMREISRQVARGYLDERERLGFPWSQPAPVRSARRAALGKRPTRPADFVLEVGTEELPAGDLDHALAQLETKIPVLLETERLAHRRVEIMGTPRRLVVWVRGLAPRQADRTRRVKGPPADRAFEPDGTPTQAARGFARSAGVPLAQLEFEESGSGRYVVANVREAGRAAVDVLAERLPGLLGSLEFEQPMRWNSSGASFARPVRWVLALHGSCLVGFEFAGLRSGRITRRFRSSRPDRLQVRTTAEYFERLREAGIVLEPERRKAAIASQLRRLGAPVKGKVPEDPELLGQVANLVEAPVAVRGQVDPRYLSLPPEVLVSVMKVYQRYFPIEGRKGLLPYFIAVGNGVGGRPVIRGNEEVLRARLADAAYFVARDSRQPLAAYVAELASITYQTDLGSMLDKTRRIQRLIEPLGARLGLSPADARTAARAAELCKADLATQMVQEMTSLQGAMGRQYALQSGEPAEVAQAIYEHYLPHKSGDTLPATGPGMALGVADRLDSLVGLFAVGMQPTGTRDPYGLRRTAIGLIQILADRPEGFDLRAGLELAAEGLAGAGKPPGRESILACLEFILARAEGLLLAEGWPHDVVQAILGGQGHDPHGAARGVAALARWVKRPDWPKLLQAFARCARITRGVGTLPEFDPAQDDDPSTQDLYAALLAAENSARQPGSVDGFVDAFRPMIPIIDRFFEQVLVMADERVVRENRLALLRRIVGLADGVADLSKLEGF